MEGRLERHALPRHVPCSISKLYPQPTSLLLHLRLRVDKTGFFPSVGGDSGGCKGVNEDIQLQNALQIQFHAGLQGCGTNTCKRPIESMSPGRS